jgi:hypothetical protein
MNRPGVFIFITAKEIDNSKQGFKNDYYNGFVFCRKFPTQWNNDFVESLRVLPYHLLHNLSVPIAQEIVILPFLKIIILK